jgi:ATP-dependent DNA helicase RecG
MYRLVQGDVGCGKTAVAALGMYAAVTSGCQAALLAPTEILARQHLESLQSLLKGTDVKIDALYSGLSAPEKRRVLAETEKGETDILVGTHSLIQEGVVFANLGMVVADEQQRFGVEQRKALRQKGKGTDFLLMSATPIPRTLASTLYGDMDVSTVETMPAGRKIPKTVYIEENSFRSVLNEVKELLSSGRQLYIICAAVEYSEEYDARNVHDTAENIRKLFPMYHVGILHGRMSSEEKQEAMESFYRNETQILVATTVVEVGMNVINATGMIVYDADRFGLSQLHQLRGRIQRGSEQGKCWLLSGSHEDKVKERLNVLVKTNNGFEISYEDLRLRGPGDILGTRQSGVPDFILGNLISDTGIINTARNDAKKIISFPDNPDYIPLLETVREASRNSASYAD